VAGLCIHKLHMWKNSVSRNTVKPCKNKRISKWSSMGVHKMWQRMAYLHAS